MPAAFFAKYSLFISYRYRKYGKPVLTPLPDFARWKKRPVSEKVLEIPVEREIRQVIAGY
ncbi:hypothetical protein K9F62_10145 [Desulfovibrio sp. JY]|nr:hypothetical protein K9F62_10145 [Desulfovibrio sp. JY]